MRILHLCFELHSRANQEDFARENKEIFQPFLALLERNTQKFPELKVSLVVTGMWLNRAQKFDAELVERLRKLVRAGKVELVATTYYHSLANFYDAGEAAAQVAKSLEADETALGKKPRVFALPELVYNDEIGRFAENQGFAAMIAGGGAAALNWRSANHIYEAAGCEYLRLIFPNLRLSKMVAQADEKILAEKEAAGAEAKKVLSVAKFRKFLDLDFLRGGIITLYFDAQIFAERYGEGVIGFFDDLFENWLSGQGDRFVGVTEACVVETPTAAVSVRQTVSARESAPRETKLPAGVVRKSDVEFLAPDWLDAKLAKQIYDVRREVLAAADENLLEKWRELTAIDAPEGLADLGAELSDLKLHAVQVKKSQAVEISRVYTKRHERGQGEPEVEESATNEKPQPVLERAKLAKIKRVPVNIDGVAQPVKVVRPRKPVVPKVVELGEPEAEPVDVSEKAAAVEVQTVEKPKKVRKIIKKFVIE